ncbi:unnamed protein product [Didymodactylos carnosus]|uniref:Uncharacterized protein n=1 Tax=Didymodactylos carnosus TaxID=1234261 RepID=A0A8S2CZU4_9BILA|nr:unnamed protein product [Didymodactylos carnosus]CAF3562774.1 unnamed protein product [Didymodactylos carnosus]
MIGWLLIHLVIFQFVLPSKGSNNISTQYKLFLHEHEYLQARAELKLIRALLHIDNVTQSEQFRSLYNRRGDLHDTMLLDKLHEKLQNAKKVTSNTCKTHPVLIIGFSPSSLRMAIECLYMGCSCVIVSSSADETLIYHMPVSTEMMNDLTDHMPILTSIMELNNRHPQTNKSMISSRRLAISLYKIALILGKQNMLE